MLKVPQSYSNFDELYNVRILGKATKLELTEMADGESPASDEVGIRLTNIIETPRTVSVKRSVNGKNVFVSVTLAPGKTYAISKSEDVFINDLKTKQDRCRRSPETEAWLKEKGVEYSVKKGCGSCGSKGTLLYRLVEVIE